MKELSHFIKQAKPHAWGLVLGTFLSALTAVAGILLLALAGWFITAGALTGIGLGAVGTLTFYGFQTGSAFRNLGLIRVLGRYMERLVSHNAAFRILTDLRLAVFREAVPLAPGRLGKLKPGSLLSRVFEDVEALDNLYLRIAAPVMAAVTAFLVAEALAFYASPKAGLGLAVVFLTAVLVGPLLALRAGKKPGERLSQAREHMRTTVTDMCEGLAEIKIFQAEHVFLHHLMQARTKSLRAEEHLMGGMGLSGALAMFMGPAAFLLITGSAVLEGASPPLCMMAGFAALALFETVPPVLQAAQLMGRTEAAARHLLELRTMTPTASQPETTAQSPPQNHDVRFEHVSLTYPEGREALHDMSFTLKEGGRLAVLGPSGCGKTSIFNLLMRFYDPQKGKIFLGGQDLLTLQHETSHQYFALAGQQTRLISGTIEENLRLAAPQASEEALWQALEQACAADLVTHLPEGLQTWVGAKGEKLSGGQARRLTLARAFLKNAPVLLLDEPTESLDSETEKHVIRGLENWLESKPSRTLFLATHRTAPLDLTDDHITLFL